MPYLWLTIALESLRDLEPFEVNQALASSVRWPRIARSDAGLPVLTIWARTSAGRGVIVVLRRAAGTDWEIVGARVMRADEAEAFDKWEADDDTDRTDGS